jgi:ubiquinone/menaquinone biosynthesis C-methylase UbiE
MDIGGWLRGLRLGQYEATFRESEIDGEVLPELTESDPEPEMLRAARRNAAKAGKEIEFVLGSAGDLGPQFGRLHPVTIGRAFHWMDRPRTLEALDALIEPNGGIALFQESYSIVPVNDW